MEKLFKSMLRGYWLSRYARRTPLMKQLKTYYDEKSDPRSIILWLFSCGANAQARDIYAQQVLYWAVNGRTLQSYKGQDRIERYVQTESGPALNPERHSMVVCMICDLILHGADIYAFDDECISIRDLAEIHGTLEQLKWRCRHVGYCGATIV